ncbi:putative hexokinase [Cryptosporidium felis]|nr:putative hexokinase [Cryptosporidium felis]
MDDRTVEEQFGVYEKYFCLSRPRLLELVEDFYQSMKIGLEARKGPGNPGNNHGIKALKMLDSCIESPPTGKERGVFYAIDMGGTNLRCVRVELKGGGQSDSRFKKVKLAEAKVSADQDSQDSQSGSENQVGILDSRASSESMFDYIAVLFRDFLEECGDLGDFCRREAEENGLDDEAKLQVAFTFSFPVVQRGIRSASLVRWTKGIETGKATGSPVEGRDVGELLNLAFRRNRVPAFCKCIINDTVGTLLSAMYDLNSKEDFEETPEDGGKEQTPGICQKPLLGIVIGTGVNACYFEPEALSLGYKGVIINSECGDFYSPRLPSTDCDLVLDWNSDNRGEQRFEKMISGSYLGEISRLMIINFLKHKTPEALFKRNSFKTEHISEIVRRFDDKPDTSSIIEFLQDSFSSPFDSKFALIITKISQMVLRRAASLVSILLAAFAKRLCETQNCTFTVAIDGSVWAKVPFFRKHVQECLFSLTQNCHSCSSLQFYESVDGSGRGAAILVGAVIDSESLTPPHTLKKARIR